MSEVTLTDDQLEAIVARRVEAAMQKHAADLDALRKNRDEILYEKKQLQSTALIERSARLNAAADRLLVGNRGSLGSNASTTAGYRLSREEARDPAKWRSAKAAALRAGVSGPEIIGEDAPFSSGVVVLPAVVETCRAIYARRDVYRNTAEFRRLKRDAERDGRPVVPYESRADLERMSGADPDALVSFDAARREPAR